MRAVATGVVGLAIAATLDTLAALHVGGPLVTNTVGLYGDAVLEFLSAGVIFWASMQLSDTAASTVWRMVALSMLLMGVGDVLWDYDGLMTGVERLGLNLGDAFYIASYIVFGVALVRYALTYHERVDIVWIATETLVATAAAGVTLWIVLMAPALRSANGVTPVRAGDLIYVVLDFPLLLAPVLCVLLVKTRVREPFAIEPWISVTTAVIVTILADVLWVWERARGTWDAGSLADFAFMAAAVLFAVGAMSAVDAQERARRHRALLGD